MLTYFVRFMEKDNIIYFSKFNSNISCFVAKIQSTFLLIFVIEKKGILGYNCSRIEVKILKKNRNIPFGYMMENGEIQLNPTESNAVQEIFQSYLDGSSLNEIARLMMIKKIQYIEVSSVWNKNMVKRILENKKYLGTADFAAIIDAQTFHKANEKKQQKATKTNNFSEDLKVIRSLIHCKVCGKKLSRISGKYEKWDCKNAECERFEFRLTDETLISEVAKILNFAIANPSLIEVSEEISEYSPTLEITRQQNEIDRIFDTQNLDFEKAKEEIFKLVSMKYDCCTYNDKPRRTGELKLLLEDAKQLNTLDIGLLKSTVSWVLIGHFCTIEIEFINGAKLKNTMERNDENDTKGNGDSAKIAES